MAELMEIIGARLSADTDPGGVNDPDDGATGGFHSGKAPQDAGYPRVVVKLVTGLPRHTLTQEGARQKFVQFMVYGTEPMNGGETGTGKVTRLNKRVQFLFNHTDEEINDPLLLSSMLERELPQDVETDSQGRDIYSEGCIFEMWTT